MNRKEREINIFCSYSHNDSKLKDKLKKHLSSLLNKDYIGFWHDKEIQAGEEWEKKIDEHLHQAQIIIFLISADFLYSHYCFHIEAKKAMELHQERNARVIPIILRPCDWQSEIFAKLQALPENGKPITTWENQDSAFTDIAEQIRNVVEDLRSTVDPDLSGNSTTPSPDVFPIRPSRYDPPPVRPVKDFYGREDEISKTKTFILDEQCSIVTIFGMRGIGKTTLVAKVVEQIKSNFDYCIWRFLQDAPPAEEILKDFINRLSPHQGITLPTQLKDQVHFLMTILEHKRCLFVITNVESILEPISHMGQYRREYEGYSQLFKTLGETVHNSCLILTTEEKPREINEMETRIASVKSLNLQGLNIEEAKKLLEQENLKDDDTDKERLIRYYSCNPLALKIAARDIKDLFPNGIKEYFQDMPAAFGDIFDLLDQQYQRLSELEKEVVHWLSISREGCTVRGLAEDFIFPVNRGELLNVLKSLKRRSLLESVEGAASLFKLQPVFMDYITAQLINIFFEEIENETITHFDHYALIKALGKEYIRNIQVRLILLPMAEKLIFVHGRESLKQKFSRLLSQLRDSPNMKGYAAGNILNMMIHLNMDLNGFDFSHLTIRQAYLQGVVLPGVNFSQSEFFSCMFTEKFGSVLPLVFSPDGEMFAAGTTVGDIRVWRYKDMKQLYSCKGHTDWVRSVAFTPDGKRLISGSNDRTVRIWDVENGNLRCKLKGHSSRVRAVCCHPKGRYIASGSDDSTVRIWDMETSECINTLIEHKGRVWAVVFSPGNRFLATASTDKTIKLWDIDGKESIQTFTGHSSSVLSLAFHPDGTKLVSASDDQTIRVWDVASGQCEKVLEGHTKPVWHVAFNSKGDLLASAGGDNTVRLWDVARWELIKTFHGHKNRVRSVSFKHRSNIMASGSEDQTIRFWDIETEHCVRSLCGHTNEIRTVIFSPDGKKLATTSEDLVIRLWNVSSGECIHMLRGHSNWVWLIAFSPDSRILASASEDRTIRLWQLETGNCIRTLTGHYEAVWDVEFSPDGKLLASASEDLTVGLWDFWTGQLLKSLKGHKDRVWRVKFSLNGKILASTSDDGEVRLWDLNSATPIRTLKAHPSAVWSIAFSPDCKTFATSSEDKTIKIWDIRTGACLNTLKGHEGRVWCIAYNPVDGILASCSEDRTIRLWDTQHSHCLKTLSGHSYTVWGVAFSPDGRLLASASGDETIKCWDLQTYTPVKTLMCERPYESMNITGVKGLTEAQIMTLKTLGAVNTDISKNG